MLLCTLQLALLILPKLYTTLVEVKRLTKLKFGLLEVGSGVFDENLRWVRNALVFLYLESLTFVFLSAETDIKVCPVSLRTQRKVGENFISVPRINH